jgi:hypothetical protein
VSLQDTYPCDCGERIDFNINYCPNCGEPVEVEWPLEFSLSARSSPTTSEQVEMANLPHTDGIADALYRYPGEVVIHFKMNELLEVDPFKIEYNGTVWTPEGQDE